MNLMHGESEPELMDRLSNRDPQALAAIYDCYARTVYSLFVRITHDRTAAEDLTQELFFRVWNRAPMFDTTKGALGAWVLSVTRHMAIDYMRSASAKFGTNLLGLEHIERLSGFNPPVAPELLLSRAAMVKAALLRLDDNERQVLELAYFEGYSQSEIADRLQRPLGTVKTWTRAALVRFRLALDSRPSKRIPATGGPQRRQVVARRALSTWAECAVESRNGMLTE